MKRKNKQKLKLTIVLITILLFLIAIIVKNMNSKENIPTNEEPVIEENKDNEEENNSEEEQVEDEPLEEEPSDENFSHEPVDEPKKPEKQDPIEKPGKEDIKIVEKPDSIDVLVNRKYNLPDTYVPKDLVSITDLPTVLLNPEINQLREPAYEALKDLFAAAQEAGFELYARSGYRSYNTQASLYSSYVANHGQEAADTFSAKAGQSEHQTGLAMDITCEAVNFQLAEAFGETEEGKWVAENAHRFGFIIRYPKGKEEVTGYMYEPWHIRYLGVELATNVYESGLTLEEYFE